MGQASGHGPSYLLGIQIVNLPLLQAWVHPADAIKLRKATGRRSKRNLCSGAAKLAACIPPQQPSTRWATHTLTHHVHRHACKILAQALSMRSQVTVFKTLGNMLPCISSMKHKATAVEARCFTVPMSLSWCVTWQGMEQIVPAGKMSPPGAPPPSGPSQVTNATGLPGVRAPIGANVLPSVFAPACGLHDITDNDLFAVSHVGTTAFTTVLNQWFTTGQAALPLIDGIVGLGNNQYCLTALPVSG